MDTTRWNFLVVLRPTRGEMLTDGPTDREIDIIGRHFAYYEDLTAAGRALIVGRTQVNTPETMGLAIVHAPDMDSACSLAESDPAVGEGVMSCAVYPYAIALYGG